MFEKSDDVFAQLATDSERRRSAIKDYRRRRTILFWCAVVSSLGFLPIPWFSGGHVVSASSAFVAAIMWAMTFKFDSDRKVLVAIDLLSKD